MTQQAIKKKKRICRNPGCQKEYEAKVATVISHEVVLGDGLCPQCAKAEYEKEEARERQGRETLIKMTKQRWFSQCGIPPRFLKESFETFDKTKQPKHYKLCLDYAMQFPFDALRGYKSLIMFSEHSWGVGKTHLATSIGRKIIERWNGEGVNWELKESELRKLACPVLFISEPELYTRIQAGYNAARGSGESQDSEASVIKQCVSAKLLILDDVGKRKVTDSKFVNRIMFSIIQGRYNAELPMVMTANLSSGGLAVYLSDGQGDEASMDRLVEMCKGEFYKIEGESYRRGVKIKG